MFLSFNLFVGAFVRNDQSLRDWDTKDRDERDRLYERLNVPIIRYDSDKMNLTLLNNGPETVHIVRIWVTNFSASPPWHKLFNVNIYVNPGETKTNVGYILGSFRASQSFTVKLVTERGNLYTAQKFFRNVIVGFAFGIGWLVLNWTYWFFTSTNYPNLTPSWLFNKNDVGNTIQFQMQVTNHWDRDVTLVKFTRVQFSGAQANANDLVYYLMAPGSTPSSLVPYDPSQPGVPITVPKNTNGDWSVGGTPTVMKFYSGKAGTANQPGALRTDDFAVYLILFYSYPCGSQTCTDAQTIPFLASTIQ